MDEFEPITPEPAGWRSLLTGRFRWRQTNHPKRLWDQLRLSRAYGPWGEFAMAEPDPPRWFIEEWLADRHGHGKVGPSRGGRPKAPGGRRCLDSQKREA